MRLTLRTLLAYLDDTLDATEIKGIGQKVAESDAAQELIARIKQVTRRRRLTTPPLSGPNARFDPNDVGEYLDNELSADKVAELEKLALESDVHLAEIAACHQILTLVLGEPALVPPTARTRMYALVHGGGKVTAAPKPAQPAKTATAGEEEDLLGLPILRHGWLRWVLPVAGVFLLVAIGLAVWQILPDQAGPKQPGNGKSGGELAITNAGDKDKGEADKDKKREKEPNKDGSQEAGKDKDNKDKDKKEKEEQPKKGSGKKRDKAPKRQSETEEEETPPAGEGTVERAAAPSTDRAVVATYRGAPDGLPSVLVHQPAEDEPSKRVKPRGSIYSTDLLVSLPGYMSDLVTRKGAGLLLRGNLPEFAVHPNMTFLMESAVVLHKSDRFALDLTLLRGRVFLSNQARDGPVAVRLRFEREVWDLTLQEPGTEVGVDLLKHYSRDINYRDGEPPRAELELSVLKGRADLRYDYQTHHLQAPPGPARFHWDNFEKANGPIDLKGVPAIWSRKPALDKTMDPQLAKEMTVALRGLAGRLEGKDLGVALKEGVEREESTQAARLLSIYGMAAIDEMGDLLDRLEDTDANHWRDRQAAIFCLRRWISRSAQQGRLLYHADKKSGARTGLLVDRKYRSSEAQTLFDLLHDFSVEDARNRDTYDALARYLESPKVAIAELAYWHLLRLTFGSKVKLPLFNGAAPPEDRKRAADQVHDLVKNGKLPPPPPPREEGAPPKEGG
jgi:hypothetical protein